MSTNDESNGFLYFIVGALVVAVGVVGYLYMNDEDVFTHEITTITKTEPAAGNEQRSEFNLRVDENGVEATQKSK